MAKFSINDIARHIATKHKLSQAEAERVVEGMIDVINDGLRYEKQVKVKGLGTFKVIETKDRESVNVNTGERIVIEGRGKITFTPDLVMRDLVNRPFSQFETVVINEGVDVAELEAVPVLPPEETSAPRETEPSMPKQAEEMPLENESAAIIAPMVHLVDASQETETPNGDEETKTTEKPEKLEQAVESEPAEELVSVVEPEPTVEPQPIEQHQPAEQRQPVTSEPSESTVESEPVDQPVSAEKPNPIEEQLSSEESEHSHHSHHSHHHSSSSESSRSYHRHMHYQHLMEKQEKRYKRRLAWLTVLGTLAALFIAAGAFMAGKRLGASEMTAKMEEPLVDNYLSEDSMARIIEADARLDSAERAALLAKRQSDYALKKRAREFTQHAENVDITSRQQAEEMTEAKLRRQASEMKRMEDEKRAQTEARARAEAKAKEEAAKAKAKADADARAKTAQQPKPQQSNPAVASKQSTGGFSSAKYDQMNAQVRLGAYRIVGVDQTVTVRKGQTLASISKAFLGPGMECYVEALNDGVKTVSEGQKLKIPKLELRKKSAKK